MNLIKTTQSTLATLHIYEIHRWQMQMIVSEINLIQLNMLSVFFNPKPVKGQHSESEKRCLVMR